MINRSINEVKTCFATLGVQNVSIKFNGKSLNINGKNFRIPIKSKSTDYIKGIDFDDKVIEYVQSLLPENIYEISEKYTKLLNDLKAQNIRIDFTYLNYGCTVSRDIRNSIENARKLLEFTENYPEFYSIIDKYSAYRNLVERGWEYITE